MFSVPQERAVSARTLPGAFTLKIPAPKVLTSGEELALARKAYERSSGSMQLLLSLAGKLVRSDRFAEAATLLESVREPDFNCCILLYHACIGFETEEGNRKAQDAAARAVDIATTPEQRGAALAALAKTYTRLNELSRAEEFLREALLASPHDKDAYKRLSILLLNRDPEEALRFANEMVGRGILHARVLGSIPAILARMNRIDEARAFEALDEFQFGKTLAPPEGWKSLEEFNNALAVEILNHPDMRYERYGTASNKTWRVDQPSLQRSRLVPQLQQAIRREILTHVAELKSDHPLAKACPSEAWLRNWCVVTQGDGHETWHVHQNGWMSGVYYIHVQDHISQGTGPGGCLALGMSDEIAGQAGAEAYGERLVRPHTGLMMMFPSHSFHKTYPHHGPGHRICFAFDIIPD